MSNARSPTIVLATLMIAAILTPALSAVEDRSELRDTPVAMEAAPDPCLGYDACTGQDAGGYDFNNQLCPSDGGLGCDTIDLTPYMDWDETTSFYGYIDGSAGCGTTTYCDDEDTYLSLIHI